MSQSSPVPWYLTLCGPVDTLDSEEFVDDVSDRAEYEGAHKRETDRDITATRLGGGWKGWCKAEVRCPHDLGILYEDREFAFVFKLQVGYAIEPIQDLPAF